MSPARRNRHGDIGLVNHFCCPVCDQSIGVVVLALVGDVRCLDNGVGG